jgi:hypothetical protein
MVMKRKCMAIFVILLLLALSVSIAEASEVSVNEQNPETISVELTAINPDGTQTTENLHITQEQLTQLENAISTIMDQIQSANSLNENILRDIIGKILGNENSLIGRILGIFTTLKLSKNRGFVISSGHGIDYTPLNKISFKISKKLAAWHYNSNGMIDGRTIIVKPLALDMKILRGTQFGVMSRFVGVYLSVSQGFLRNSYTLFMGTARNINGIQFSSAT